MNRPETEVKPAREIVPGRKLTARVALLLKASGEDFASSPVDSLEVTYEGVMGDFHAGLTRRSGGREPWYARGTEMRNERQLSILSSEELAAIAENMGLGHIEPGWIGANLVVRGVPDMSFLPPRTLLIFESGVTLRVDGYNAPCRIAGGAIAKSVGAARISAAPSAKDEGGKEAGFDWTRTDTALAFTHAAEMKRGLVAWVEREGVIRTGEALTVRVGPQWLY
jgi:hypothetical protein